MLTRGKPKRARQGTVLREAFDLRLDQNDIFEIDRSNLILQIRTIRRAINESAEEMEMVAIERVFVNSVSQAITRKLYRVAEELNGLHRMIERTHLPKQPARSNPKSQPLPRRQGRN